MAEIVDVELALRSAGTGYTADMAVDKGRDSRRKYGPFPVEIDLLRLRELSGDASAYGQALTAMLFESDGLREVLVGASWAAEERGVPLRLRLWLASGAEDLHALRWELLTLPGRSEPLCTREDILFSRFLPANQDALPRPRGALRALAAFANPTDLPDSLAPIDVPRWKEHARTGLAGMDVDWLPATENERCTLDRLAQRIPGHDVLFLVCHGKMIRGEGWLVLENPDGSHARVPAGDLTRRLAGASRLPRLAVLVVCESAGTTGVTDASSIEALGAIAPRLVEAGIPAVLAMQDGLTFESAEMLLPALFSAIQQDGIIDRAAAVARRAILGRPDEAAPVLLMSLVSGRLWEGEPAPEPADEPAVPVSDPKPEPPKNRVPAAQVDQRVLYAAMTGEAFELQDLRELCFLLGVDWENLRGETKPAKAMAMIRYFTSRGIYAQLVEAVREARPSLEL